MDRRRTLIDRKRTRDDTQRTGATKQPRWIAACCRTIATSALLIGMATSTAAAPTSASTVIMPTAAVEARSPAESGRVLAGERTPARDTRSGGLPSRSTVRWAWPLLSPRLTNVFLAPADRYSAGHRGIDLAASPGAEIRAPESATVRFAGRVADRSVLTLDHRDGVLSSYEPVETTLSVGDLVTRGQVLGQMSSGGHCADSCLHVGVRVGGEYASPLLFFGRVPSSVLLPLKR